MFQNKWLTFTYGVMLNFFLTIRMTMQCDTFYSVSFVVSYENHRPQSRLSQ